MFDEAEYCGDIPELKGKIALVKSDETYHAPLENRTLDAQFHWIGLIHPATKVDLSRGWHKFKAEDFKLLVTVRT